MYNNWEILKQHSDRLHKHGFSITTYLELDEEDRRKIRIFTRYMGNTTDSITLDYLGICNLVKYLQKYNWIDRGTAKGRVDKKLGSNGYMNETWIQLADTSNGIIFRDKNSSSIISLSADQVHILLDFLLDHDLM